MHPKTLTLGTGASLCGKSTIFRLIVEYLADKPKAGKAPKILWGDTSAFIANSKRLKTKAGLELLAQEHDQNNGVILQAKPVFECIFENLAMLPDIEQVENFLLAGSTRHPDESLAFLVKGVDFRLVHIESTKLEVEEGLQRRIASGALRADDAPGILETKWKEYETKVKPAVACLPKGLVISIKRSWPLVDRLETVINRMILPDNVRTKWRNKLHTANHPIHAAIRAIESPLPLKNATGFPVHIQPELPRNQSAVAMA